MQKENFYQVYFLDSDSDSSFSDSSEQSFQSFHLEDVG